MARRVRASGGHVNSGRISAYRRHASPRSASGSRWKSAIVYPVTNVASPPRRTPGPRTSKRTAPSAHAAVSSSRVTTAWPPPPWSSTNSCPSRSTCATTQARPSH